jgi:hypothetical protein
LAVPRSTAMSRPRNVSALLIGNGTFRSRAVIAEAILS